MTVEQRRRFSRRATATILGVGVPMMALATAGAIYIVNDLADLANQRAKGAEEQAQEVDRRLAALEAKTAEADRRSLEQRAQTLAIAMENRKALCTAIRQLVTPQGNPRSMRVMVTLAADLECKPVVSMPDFPEAAKAAPRPARGAKVAPTVAPKAAPPRRPAARPPVQKPRVKPPAARPPAAKPKPKPPRVSPPKRTPKATPRPPRVDPPAAPKKPKATPPRGKPKAPPGKGRKR